MRRTHGTWCARAHLPARIQDGMGFRHALHTSSHSGSSQTFASPPVLRYVAVWHSIDSTSSAPASTSTSPCGNRRLNDLAARVRRLESSGVSPPLAPHVHIVERVNKVVGRSMSVDCILRGCSRSVGQVDGASSLACWCTTQRAKPYAPSRALPGPPSCSSCRCHAACYCIFFRPVDF